MYAHACMGLDRCKAVTISDTLNEYESFGGKLNLYTME